MKVILKNIACTNNLLMYVILLLMSTGYTAKAQNEIAGKDTTALKINIMERPQLSDSFEVLDLNVFKKDLIVKKEITDVGRNKLAKVYADEYFRSDSINEVQIYGKYSYICRLKNTPYTVVKIFYPNKSIKRKWICFDGNYGNSLTLGKEYFFDVQGKLTKTINHDQGWDFSFEKVMAYIEKRGCKLIKYDTQNEIAKKENTAGRKYWDLVLYTDEITGRPTREIIKLDGKTGEILSQVEEEGHFMWHLNVQHVPPKVKIIVPDKTGKTKEPK